MLRAAERRRKSEIYLGFAEFNAVAGDCERRGFCDLAASAMGEPVDRSDDRLWECLDPSGQPLPAACELSQGDCLAAAHACRKTRNVGPGRKSAVASAGQDERADIILVLDGVEHLHQSIDQ